MNGPKNVRRRTRLPRRARCRQQNAGFLARTALDRGASLSGHEQREAIARKFEEVAAKCWEEMRVNQAAIMRQMQEQRGRVGRMVSWLDQCPVPPPLEGRGA